MPEYQRPRLAVPNPLSPAQYNKEQVEARLGRKVSGNVVRTMDGADDPIDQKIEQIKEQARGRIAKVATQAHNRIAALQAQKVKGAK